MATHFISSCGDAQLDQAAQKPMKLDVFQDTLIGIGNGYNGTNCWDAVVTPYTRVRCVKAVSPSPSNVILFGGRWYAGPGTFPLAGGTSWLLAAVHHKGASAGYQANAGTKQLSINIATDGRLEFRRGGYTGTLVAETVSPVLSNDTWTPLGFRLAISSTAGTIDVVRNGAPVPLTLSTGLNTQALAAAALDAVEWVPWRWDDVWTNDLSGSSPAHTTFFGPGFHVKAARMVANHAVQWVPLSDANYENIDDASADANATKVSSQFAGDVDLYTIENIPDFERVYCVQANAVANKSSASVAASLAHVVEINGIRYESAPLTVQTGQLDLRAVWPVAPDDGAAWTTAKIRAAKWGFKRVS